MSYASIAARLTSLLPTPPDDFINQPAPPQGGVKVPRFKQGEIDSDFEEPRIPRVQSAPVLPTSMGTPSKRVRAEPSACPDAPRKKKITRRGSSSVSTSQDSSQEPASGAYSSLLDEEHRRDVERIDDTVVIGSTLARDLYKFKLARGFLYLGDNMCNVHPASKVNRGYGKWCLRLPDIKPVEEIDHAVAKEHKSLWMTVLVVEEPLQPNDDESPYEYVPANKMKCSPPVECVFDAEQQVWVPKMPLHIFHACVKERKPTTLWAGQKDSAYFLLSVYRRRENAEQKVMALTRTLVQMPTPQGFRTADKRRRDIDAASRDRKELRRRVKKLQEENEELHEQIDEMVQKEQDWSKLRLQRLLRNWPSLVELQTAEDAKPALMSALGFPDAK
jgi:hypothetical protein